MSSIALLFVGAVLLLNGLVFLGRVDARAAIPINLLAGSLLVLTALLQAATTSPTSPDYRMTLFGAVGFTLFGFTYLTVGANSLLGGTGTALGWYCGWAAIIASTLAAVNFTSFSDHRIAWLWIAWAVLFLSFFLALILGHQRLGHAAGILAIIQSVTTASVPGMLMVNESWATLPITLIGTVQILGIIAYAVAVTRRPTATPPTLPRETIPVPTN